MNPLEKKIRHLVEQLEQAKLLQTLAATQEWKALSVRVERVLLGKINRLCDPKCDQQETWTLRAEIGSLRWFLRATQIDTKLMATSMERLKGLQAMAQRMQNAGAAKDSDLSKALSDADDVIKNLEDNP